jgi:hypothetical protein
MFIVPIQDLFYKKKKKKTHELMVKLNHTITKIQFVAEVFFLFFLLYQIYF